MNKNVLYITFDGLSDPLGQSQVIPYLTGIAKAGYSITILSCEKPDRLKTEQEKIKSQLQSSGIQWKYIIYNEEGNFLSRLSYVRQIKRLAVEECRSKKYNIVHCRSYLASLIGLSLKNKLGLKFIFDMRGLWADERVDGKIWSKSNPLQYLFYSYFKRKEKQFIVNCDALISLTHNGLNYLSHNFPEANLRAKSSVIPCCVNTTNFSKDSIVPDEEKPVFAESDHVLVYAGSIGTWYNTHEMIECVVVWKEMIPNIKLLVVTRDATELENVLAGFTPEERNLVKIISAPYSKMPSILSQAKASIFFIKPAFSKIASSPTKMAECWAMNLPIITNTGIGDNDIYFNEHKGGVLVKQFRKEEYKMACVNYMALLAKNANYRQLALEYFDSGIAVKTYVKVYDKLTD